MKITGQRWGATRNVVRSHEEEEKLIGGASDRGLVAPLDFPPEKLPFVLRI